MINFYLEQCTHPELGRPSPRHCYLEQLAKGHACTLPAPRMPWPLTCSNRIAITKLLVVTHSVIYLAARGKCLYCSHSPDAVQPNIPIMDASTNALGCSVNIIVQVLLQHAIQGGTKVWIIGGGFSRKYPKPSKHVHVLGAEPLTLPCLSKVHSWCGRNFCLIKIFSLK